MAGQLHTSVLMYVLIPITKTLQITDVINVHKNVLLVITHKCVLHALKEDSYTQVDVFRVAQLSLWLLMQIPTDNVEQVFSVHQDILL